MARVKKEFVTDKLNELYLTKWKAQGKTQREFAEAIRNVDPSSGINETYVSKLLNGVYSPKSYLPAICEVLDVDISEFTPKTHDDRYQYATAFADGLEGTLEGFAKEHFGIDLTFFQGLRNIIPEFDSIFPVYAPLCFYDVNSYDTNGRERNVFERRVPAEAMETSSLSLNQLFGSPNISPYSNPSGVMSTSVYTNSVFE